MREKGAKQQWRQALAMRVLETRRLILSRLAAPDRARLVAEEGDNTPASDVLDVVSNRIAREIEVASREALVRRLRSLERACHKVRAGRYGECEGCGQAIPRRRLEAMPEALFCAPCQEERERVVPRAHGAPRARGA